MTDTPDKKKLNTVIIDDDRQSRKLLSILLKKFPEINLVGEASDISSAIKIIQEKKPDSIFLDVCLGSDSGFKIAENISGNPNIVFISAYDDYALKAFEVDALDYIQKPIIFDRLALTIDRLLAQNNFPSNDIIIKEADIKDRQIKSGLEETEVNADSKVKAQNILGYDDRLFITSDGTSKFIKINCILFITAEKDYSYINLVNGKKLLVLKTMSEWEERLTPKYFSRIHRSTIINLEYVEKVEKWFNSSFRVYLQGINEPLQMSRRYAVKLKERFK